MSAASRRTGAASVRQQPVVTGDATALVPRADGLRRPKLHPPGKPCAASESPRESGEEHRGGGDALF